MDRSSERQWYDPPTTATREWVKSLKRSSDRNFYPEMEQSKKKKIYPASLPQATTFYSDDISWRRTKELQRYDLMKSAELHMHDMPETATTDWLTPAMSKWSSDRNSDTELEQSKRRKIGLASLPQAIKDSSLYSEPRDDISWPRTKELQRYDLMKTAELHWHDLPETATTNCLKTGEYPCYLVPETAVVGVLQKALFLAARHHPADGSRPPWIAMDHRPRDFTYCNISWRPRPDGEIH